MADIKAIDKTTVHRICSGQVVLSLAVAVKELVENSLDAGATVVDVRCKEFGSELIEVSDNGFGIDPSNFQGLTLKHHTSKIQDFSDLMSVETFGFRGEALSSLCALSELSAITRHASQECGTALFFDRNGYIVEEKRQARQVGTTVFVKNLFSSLPVRQKEFHKNLKREFHKMTQLLYAYCMVSTGVKISCSNQTQKGSKSTIMATQGVKSVKENISSLFGAKQLTSLLEFRQRDPPQEELEELKATSEDCKMFNFEGYVSSCAHGAGKAATNRQFYFINSRPCAPSKIIKQVNQVYHQFNKNQYPFVFLNICLDRSLADVNVTPDKRQIFLLHENLVLAIIKASLLDLYEKIPSTLVLNIIRTPTSSKSLIQEQTQKPNLSLFESWKHKSDLKRPSDSSLTKEMPAKQMKRDGPTQKTLESFEIKASLQSYKREPLILVSPDSSSEDLNGENEKSNFTIENRNCTADESLRDETIEIGSTFINEISAEADSGTDSNLPDNPHELADLKSNGNSIEVPETREINHSPELNVSFDSLSVEEKIQFDEIIPNKPEGKDSYENDAGSSASEAIDIEGGMKEPMKVIYDEYVERQGRTLLWSVNFDAVKSSLARRIAESEQSKTENKTANIKFHASIDPSKNDEAEKELTKEISKDMFEKMEIIGQFNLGFIIAKLDSDLLIIDQHASDEKYNFETLQKTTVISSQRLVVPQNLDLSPEHECILMDNLEIFKKNGFTFDINEEAPISKKVHLTSIPMSKNIVFGKEDIDEMIFMLQDSQGTSCRPSRVRAMFASRACRKSVMIGTALSHRLMRQLINNMGTIEHPWNCPHGRPTMRHLLNLDMITASPTTDNCGT